MKSRLRLMAGVVCAVLTLAPAHAAKKRAEAPREKESVPEAQAAARDKRPHYRYSLDVDRSVLNELADKKRDMAIEQFKVALDRFDEDNPEKPDLHFQLSELYWEKYKYLYAREEEQREAAYRKFEAERARGNASAVAPPPVDHRQSEEYRVKTLEIYERILGKYPGYGRTDEVLFSLAYNLHETGKGPQAVKRYEELISRFPDSQFVPDAYVQLGDHWFDNNNLAKAKVNFQKAYKSDVPKIHSYALYKLAWCDYNEGDLEGSLKKLQQVVDFAEKHGKEMVDLKNEALSDLVVVYVQLNRADEAVAYFFQKASKARQPKLIAKLAYGLADAGHHEPAIKTFRRMIDEDPMRPEAAEFQQAIVRSYEGLRQRDKVRAEIKRLAELYRPGGVWWKANEKSQAVLRNAFEVAEEAMRTIVTEYHQEAQNTKQVETYRLARDIYKQYVDAFASSEDPALVSDYAFNLRFYYAEILWTLEDWKAAAEQYDRVVAFKVPDRDTAREVSNESYRKTAGYNAILAWDKLLKIERGQLAQSDLKDGQKVDEKKGKGGVGSGTKIYKRSVKDLEEQPLTPVEDGLVHACDAYVALLERTGDKDKDEINVRYQAAVIHYDRNKFVEAASRFGKIIEKWPEERRSQQAADLTMYFLEAKEEWGKLAELSAQFLANKRLVKPGTEFARRVTLVAEGSRYKWIDEVIYKKEKNPSRAAEEFLKLVQDNPKAKIADRALTYAMLMFHELKQLDRGIAAGERLLKEYPGSPLEPKARFTLAGMYEKVAEFARAAQLYESFGSAYDGRAAALAELRRKHKAKPGAKVQAPAEGSEPAVESSPAEQDPLGAQIDEEQRLLNEAKEWLADAQFNAALWYEGLGQTDKAIAAYRQYVARFQDRKDAPEVQYSLALLYERAGKAAEAARAFEEYERRWSSKVAPAQAFLARYKRLTVVAAAKDSKETDKAIARLVDDLIRGYARLPQEAKADDAVLAAYAHARFLAVEPQWKAYTAVKFTRVATIRRDLDVKRKRLAELENAYTAVLAVGAGEWGIPALSRVGLAYSDLAQNIVESPTPKGLDQEQMDMYRGELQNLATPLEDKAIEALEKGLAKAYELGIYNDWTLQAQDKVNQYRPGQYAKIRQVPLQGSESFASAPLQKGSVAPAAAQFEPPASGPTAAIENGGR